MKVRLNLRLLALALLFAGMGTGIQAQADPAPKKSDTFFSGTVEDSTAMQITVSRVVLGKTQKRAFRITPDTKVEGKLRAKVRVTVRYVEDDDGDIATLIIVRPQAQPKQK